MPEYIDYVALPWVVEILVPQFLKIGVMVWLFFYWIPSKLFPQVGMEDLLDKVMFNILYTVLFIETVIPFMLVLGIYSFPMFLISLVITKLLVMKYYEKVVLHLYFLKLQNRMMTAVLNILDDIPAYIEQRKQRIKTAVREKIDAFSWISAFEKLVIAVIFLYPAFLITLRGFFTLSYGAPDTAQFFEWVSFLYKGELFYEGKTFGADFYGMTIFAFFLSNLTNAPIHAVFSIYPFYTVLFLLFGIFYFVRKMTGSTSSGLFAVFLFGVVLMSPLIDEFAGSTYITSNPVVTNIFGLKLYLPWPLEVDQFSSVSAGMIPYTRNSCGLPYEIAYAFFLPNLYFFIKGFATDEKKYIFWYAITLMLVFTFHGGIAFYLVAASVPITLWALVNRKLTWQKLKLGLLAVLFGAIAGNLWLLAISKYGGLRTIGAAAPIIDSTLQRLGMIQKSGDEGSVNVPLADFTFEQMQILLPSYPLVYFVVAVIVFFILALFVRRRFEWTSSALIAAGVLFVFCATIFGLPKLVDSTRATEAVLLSWAVISAYYFYLLVAFPLSKMGRFSAMRLMFTASGLVAAVIVAWVTPKWVESTKFWKALNDIEYSDFAYIAYKIKQDFQPYTWTIISYNPEYAEVLTKGYHYNTQDFVLEYDPADPYMRIPTPYVFLFVENRPHTYKGMEEWYYKWRPEIQENFQSWLLAYRINHPGRLKTWYESNHVTIYYLDNRDYMKELIREEKRKNEHQVEENYLKNNNFSGKK